MTDRSYLGVVAIGRNEGERLKQCLASSPARLLKVYVDSGSADGSVEWARSSGADVVVLDPGISFTAARARNVGFRRLRNLSPELEYVQFVDGDCALVASWVDRATAFLESRPDVCAVFGRRRERFPDASIYNRLCDIEWDVPLGEAKSFGGDVLIRAAALEAANGYRDDLIAGEEPELCFRLRSAGWKIWRIDSEMTIHDAGIHRFGQWWRRAVRCGHAYAEGAHLHGTTAEKHWVWETHRIIIWAFAVPVAICLLSTIFWPWGALSLLVYPLQLLRLFIQTRGRFRERSAQACFQLIGRFPEAQGYLKFQINRLLRRGSETINYKRSGLGL